MSARLKITPAIQWYEGMMLAPHHFQQQAFRHHQIESLKFRLSNPFLYGVSELTIDTVALSKGQLVISDVEAVLPDGEMIAISNVLQTSLLEYKTHHASDITVWIGIAPWYPDVSPLNKESPRYKIIEGEPVASYDDKSNLIPISRLTPIVQLYVSKEEDPSFVSIPILKLKCVQNVFSIARFTPPCFFIKYSAVLMNEIRDLSVLCRKKEEHLIKKYESVLGTKKETSTFFVLNRIREIIPILEMIVNNSILHPFEVYKNLCQVVGVLACLKRADITAQIPSYNHNDMDHAFGALLLDIQKEIEAITETYRYIPFEINENVFSLYINPEKKKILVAITFKETLQTKTDWINNTIIVSDSEIDVAIKERIIGAKRRILHINEYPEDLYDVGDLLIEIDVDEHYVFKNKKLILFNPISELIPESICWCVKES